MEFALILINQILIMFALIGCGFFFFKKGMITKQGCGELGNILVKLVIPVIAINSFWTERTPEKTALILESALIAFVALFVAMVIAAFFFGKISGIRNFAAAFSNAGFIGIPLVQSVLGEEGVFYLSIMIVLLNIIHWTYGIYIITGDKSTVNVKALLKNPVIISVVIGLVIYALNLPKPETVTTLFTTITNLNTPLAMLTVGAQLAQSDLLAMVQNKNSWYVSAVRLVIIPLAVLAVFKFMPIGNENMKLAIMIASAAPVGANVAIYAQQFHKDYSDAVEQVCLSTLLCLVTLPFIITLANMLL